ncbi:kinase-like domain-containing protein [Rhizophagus irregularis DAOM 181602=DAOM 197198]|nr:kinase-like domain-containing protein [Rhizophagus irregularis DAOM 181602=DAOM 197198]
MINENWYQTAIKEYGIKEILYKELSEKKKEKGSGAFGRVYKTKCDSIGTVAIKKITIDAEVEVIRFIKELKLHSQIKHERIIQFHGISRDEHKGHYLVLEYAKQGDLREFIEKFGKGEFKWEERKRLAIQIAEGLRYLHNEKNIIHRDLHTKNILINEGNIKISDFGLSKNLNGTMSSTNNGVFGMVPFIDPQKLNQTKYVLNKKSDIYSLGMVLWEISSCREPFPGETIILDLSLKICQGLKEKSVKGTPMEYKQIYTSCWEIEPNSRPLIEEVLSQLKSMSLEPVFEGDDEYTSCSPSPSPGTSGCILPDDLIIQTNSVICKRCDSKFTDQNWCNSCESQRFQEDFSNWTSENQSLDELIQYSQLSATKNNTYFEWIKFNQFKDIKVIKDIEDGFFTATWLDGSRELWDDRSQQWERKGPVKIILRRLRCLNINKLKLYLELENIIIYCYGFTGFTQVSSTKSKSTKSYYLMVLKYANVVKLRKYIQNKFPFSWFERLSILKKIVELLHNIHKTNYVHCNFHSGSILLQKDDLNHELEIYVSDLDFCVYSGEFYKTDEANKNNRHISPEILKGEKVSIKSDIYSLGVLMRELVSRNDPQRYYELMQKCLDDDPERRPDTKDLLEELHTFTVSRNSQFEAADSRGISPPQTNPSLHFPPFPLPSSPFPPFYEQPLPPSPLSQPLSPSPFPQFYQPHDENENDTYDFDNFDNFFNL